MTQTLTHLQRLEAGSIHILRQVVAETEQPVTLYSADEDSAVILGPGLRRGARNGTRNTTELAEAPPAPVYAKARSGRLRNFTGIDSPHEPPRTTEIRIDTTAMTPGRAADLIIARLIP